MMALVVALTQLVVQLITLEQASPRDEKAELEAMMRVSRLLHDEIAKRVLGSK